MHLSSGPEKSDHPTDSDHVAPNLLFAQQISMFCCFSGGKICFDPGNSEYFLIKKGYMEQN